MNKKNLLSSVCVVMHSWFLSLSHPSSLRAILRLRLCGLVTALGSFAPSPLTGFKVCPQVLKGRQVEGDSAREKNKSAKSKKRLAFQLLRGDLHCKKANFFALL